MSSGVTCSMSPCMIHSNPSRTPSTSTASSRARMVAAPMTLLMPGAGPPPTRIARVLRSVIVTGSILGRHTRRDPGVEKLESRRPERVDEQAGARLALRVGQVDYCGLAAVPTDEDTHRCVPRARGSQALARRDLLRPVGHAGDRLLALQGLGGRDVGTIPHLEPRAARAVVVTVLDADDLVLMVLIE